MRAFFVGLTFLAAVVILAGVWFLLFPLLLLMGLPRYTQKAPLFKAGMNGKLKLDHQESPVLQDGV